MEPVTTVLLDRTRDRGGLTSMVTFSLLGHAALVATMIMMPGRWLRSDAPQERNVMTISLGGAPGPRAGGMTMTGGRPVQEAAPPAPKPEPVRPPAAKAPDMTVPAPNAKKTAQKSTVSEAPADARGRTPTRGADTQAGDAVAQTGARGQGFGLSTGGGGGGYLDVTNFCCPEYLQTMIDRIQRNWSNRLGITGTTLMKFKILRSGRIADIEVEQPSGFFALDRNAQAALIQTELPALPSQFPDNQLTIHLYFPYER
jgi:TonB family protein